MIANKKKEVLAVLTITISVALLTVGGLWISGKRTAGFFTWGAIDAREQALELIRTRYVDRVSTDSLSQLSLDSLYLKLDPHSLYLDPNSLRIADEELAGHFAGIGIEFSRIKDTVMVIQLIPNSPSEKAGLQIGDQLIAIDSISLTDPKLSIDSIRFLVRGPVGSYANMSVYRQGKPRHLSIMRAEIPTPAVAASFLLDDTTGFIKLTRFSNKSYRETMIALEALQKKGMRALVLDLRGNGGGFLHEAVELADEFLSEDRLIVYTEGAHQPKRTYSCKRPGLFETGQLTVLMDEFSASASEVLAGALQDWCRAKIIGRRSFGKGLVQEQYALSNQGAIRLTVARYYTPLGRCIQRPYTGDRKAYLHELLNHTQKPSSKSALSNRVYFNTCGDTLFAEGGIYPDLYIQIDTVNSSPTGRKILQNPELIQLAWYLSRANSALTDTTIRSSDWAKWIPLDKIKDQIIDRMQLNERDLQSLTETDWSFIQRDLYAQIVRLKGGAMAYYRFLCEQDPFIRAAQRVN